MNIRQKTKITFLLIIAVISWACAFPFIKILLEELTYINLTIMRFTIVCTFLTIFMLLNKKKFPIPKRKEIIPIFLLGFIGIIIYHIGLNYGEQYVSPGAASLIIATIPIFTAILSIIILKEKITSKKITGFFLSLTGVVLISLLGTAETKIQIEYILGAIGVLIAAIVASLYTIAGKKMLEKHSAVYLTFYAILFGSIGLIPFIPLSNQLLTSQVLKMSYQAWGALLFLGIFSTIIAYYIWYAALKIKNASEISIFLYAIPVLSTILSYFLVDQQVTIYFILGGILVLAGLYIVNTKKQNQKLRLFREQ